MSYLSYNDRETLTLKLNNLFCFKYLNDYGIKAKSNNLSASFEEVLNNIFDLVELKNRKRDIYDDRDSNYDPYWVIIYDQRFLDICKINRDMFFPIAALLIEMENLSEHNEDWEYHREYDSFSDHDYLKDENGEIYALVLRYNDTNALYAPEVKYFCKINQFINEVLSNGNN